MKLTRRAATAEDIRDFYPEMTASFRAWVCEIDGKAEGIVGVALLRPVACLFSTVNEALRPHLKHPAVLRIIKKAEEAVKASRVPVWAAAEPGEPRAPEILGRLGFTHIGEVEGDEVYEWRPS